MIHLIACLLLQHMNLRKFLFPYSRKQFVLSRPICQLEHVFPTKECKDKALINIYKYMEASQFLQLYFPTDVSNGAPQSAVSIISWHLILRELPVGSSTLAAAFEFTQSRKRSGGIFAFYFSPHFFILKVNSSVCELVTQLLREDHCLINSSREL